LQGKDGSKLSSSRGKKRRIMLSWRDYCEERGPRAQWKKRLGGDRKERKRRTRARHSTGKRIVKTTKRESGRTEDLRSGLTKRFSTEARAGRKGEKKTTSRMWTERESDAWFRKRKGKASLIEIEKGREP